MQTIKITEKWGYDKQTNKIINLNEVKACK